MKLPRDVSGAELVKALATLGYIRARQKGSHLSLTTLVGGEHHLTIPLHDPVKPGTLNSILKDVSAHHQLSRDELLEKLEL